MTSEEASVDHRDLSARTHAPIGQLRQVLETTPEIAASVPPAAVAPAPSRRPPSRRPLHLDVVPHFEPPELRRLALRARLFAQALAPPYRRSMIEKARRLEREAAQQEADRMVLGGSPP